MRFSALLFALLLGLVLTGCDAFERNNPIDPKSESFRPQSPSAVDALLEDGIVFLSWNDESNYEDGYLIERAVDSTANFEQVARLEAGVTSFEEEVDFDGFTATYRVSAFRMGRAGDALRSEEVETALYEFSRLNTSTTVLTDQEIEVRWTDPFGFETGFQIERRKESDESFKLVGRVASDVQQYVDNAAFEQEAFYHYRVRALRDTVRSSPFGASTAYMSAQYQEIMVEVRTFSGHASSINDVAFGMSERTVFTGSSDKTVKAWDRETGYLLWSSRFPEAVTALSVHPNGQKIAVASRASDASQGAVYVIATNTGSERRLLRTGRPWAIRYGPTGNLLVMPGERQIIDARTGDVVQSFDDLSGTRGYYTGAIRSPGSGQVVFGSWNGSVRLYDINSGTLVRSLDGEGAQMDVGPEGNRVASTSSYPGCGLKITDLNTGELLQTFDQHFLCSSVLFGPQGEIAITTDRTYMSIRVPEAQVWDVESGEMLYKVEHGERVETVALTSDAQHLVTGSSDHTAKLWEKRMEWVISPPPR